jgi:CubicO group peptidase (beta-lactamase class C family)
MTTVDPVTVEVVARLGDGRTVHGFADDGLGRVVDEFVANFERRWDLGAACAVYRDGRPVVDVWAGIADRRHGTTWSHDTAAVIFSCTKGLLALCVYSLVQDGLLELDTPIATYWPGFAAHGKASITVREAMAHRSGLAALDTDLSRADVLVWEPVIRAIEAQPPHHRPNEGHLYHAMTYGWIVGEVIHRVTGLLPGQLFAQRFGGPMNLRTWIGVPADPRPPVAWMEAPLPDEDSDDAREASRLAADNPLVERSLSMGGAFGFPVENDGVSFNDPAIQQAQIAGANGVSTAASLARLYAACVGTPPGSAGPLLTEASVEDVLRVQAAGPQLSGLPDDGARWGTGFQLSSPPTQPMLGPRSFGHAGAGGQLAFADADRHVGFAYLSNQMGGYGDARARSLTDALRNALDA